MHSTDKGDPSKGVSAGKAGHQRIGPKGSSPGQHGRKFSAGVSKRSSIVDHLGIGAEKNVHREVTMNVKKLMDLGGYRGLRHKRKMASKFAKQATTVGASPASKAGISVDATRVDAARSVAEKSIVDIDKAVAASFSDGLIETSSKAREAARQSIAAYKNLGGFRDGSD